MEVAKTRLQLDGELQGRKPAVAAAVEIPQPGGPPRAGPNGKVYTSAFDCLRKTWKFEGLKGIQRGLGAAVSPFSLSLFRGQCPFDSLILRAVDSTRTKSR